MKKEKVILLLGSNVGNKFELLKLAQYHIQNEIGKIIQYSSVFVTSSWGPIQQDDFLNQVIVIECVFPPQLLLEKTLKIETDLGRKRIEKYGPRTIDIDILFYSNRIIKHEDLNIPHLQIQNRNFVLIPLLEILPNFVHPILKKTIVQLKEICPDKLKVEKWKN